MEVAYICYLLFKRNMRSFVFTVIISSFPIFTAVCQTGPGGVGDAASNLLWCDATTGSRDNSLDTADNGDKVKRLIDQSGNGNDLNQSNSGRRGILVTNSINGRSVVRFDGSNDRYQINLGAGILSNFTIFSVGNFRPANQPAGVNNTMYQLGNSINNSVNLIRLNANAGANADHYYSRTEGINRIGEFLNNNTRIYSQRFENSAPFHFLNVDGDAQVVDAHNSIITVSSDLLIGGLTGTNKNSFDGSLAEFIVFEGINRTQRIIVENHLSAKYNLGLDANDFFVHEATHGNDVAGLGQISATDNHTEARGASIVTINQPSDLEDNEFFFWGHDGAGLVEQSAEVPPSFDASGGVRYSQEWRVDVSGGDNSIGTIDLTFDVSGGGLGTDPTLYRLLIDSDGDFEDATVNPTLPNVVGNSITFVGVNIDDNDFFTLGNTNDIDDCSSLTSGDWFPVFWDCGKTPDSLTNVFILTGTTVTVTSDTIRSTRDLDIEGVLQLNDNATLIVKGNIVIDPGASFIFGDNASLILRGTNGTQSISNQSGDTIAIENLEINNTNNVTLDNGVITIADGLTLTQGNLTVNSSLRFLSTATQTAHINAIPNGSIVDGLGTISVDRFRSTRNTNWGNIASSGVITNLEDLNGEVLMSGIAGGNGYAGGTGGSSFTSVWTYDNVTDQYVSPSNTNDPFTIGQGFEIWLGDNLNTWNGQAWNLEGDLHLDDISLDMNSAGGGWNLFGNPYLGFLDWDQITSDFGNISNNEFWYVDANLGAFVNVTTGGTTIPPGQGFWILATSAADLDLDPSIHLASGVSDPTFFKQNKINEQLMIHILHENEPYGATAFLRNEPSAFTGLDKFDITPLRFRDTAACHLSIETGETDLMVNYISDYEPEVTLPIRIDAGTEGKYVVKFNGTETFKNYNCISITDEQTGESFDVIDETSFTINVDDKKVAQYLTLRLSNEEVVDCQPNNASEAIYLSNVWVNDGVINVDFHLDQPVGCDINIYNLVGEQIYSNSMTADYNREIIQINDAAAGVYIVELNMNGLNEIHKIILN